MDHPSPDLFLHIRVFVGMILGLGVTRLLTGVAYLVQHPRQASPDPLHLAWVASILLLLIHFWWWEFHLLQVRDWSFGSYLFLLFYVAVFYLLCALLFPDNITEYGGYRAYFMSRRRWFFGLLAASYLLDLGDTWLKGSDYLAGLGPEYPLRTAGYVLVCLLAMASAKLRFHQILVGLNLLYQLSYILRHYYVER